MKNSHLTGIILYGMLAIMMSCQSGQRCVLSSNTGKMHQLRTGDLVFCIGQSTKSSLVRMASCEDAIFSHVGFVVVKNGDAKMVHMSADTGVIADEPFSSYISTSNVSGLSFYRIKTLNNTYLLEQRLDSLLACQIPFDHQYDFQSSEKLYCTELIVKSLMAVGCEVFKQVVSKKYVYPDDLQKMPGLDFLFSVK